MPLYQKVWRQGRGLGEQKAVFGIEGGDSSFYQTIGRATLTPLGHLAAQVLGRVRPPRPRGC
jgi:hypothetical protein